MWPWGSPISGTMAEIFLQGLENAHTKHLLDSKNIVFYARYIDDILIIYDSTRTDPDAILEYVNLIHSNLQLSPTHETMWQVSFLELTIIRKPSKLEINVFRKPTTMDTIINYFSNHPLEHKLAAYRYHIERMLALPLTKDRQHNEGKTILLIAKNNNVPRKLLIRLKQRIQYKIAHSQPNTDTNITTKWATFTFSTHFKHTNVKITFRSSNTISQLTKSDSRNSTPPHDKCGIYKLTCNTCKSNQQKSKAPVPRTHTLYQKQ